ncbi:MAG TPA: PEP-CTERM sorting domain-containing protein [Verrucomicrobiae bacterium]|nr:PEP-CTERM sorting domain-containing protein [Verrucomicrobiae bacterium]
MKKLAALLSLSALATGAFAQGTIGFINSSTTLITTNATAAGGTAGNTATVAGGFYYGVFTAPSTVTSLTPADLLGTTWTFTGSYATNIPAGGRLSGGSTAVTSTGWPAGQTNSFVVVGWSSNLGHDWATIAAELNGSTLNNGAWAGGHWTRTGFFGLSGVGFGEAGGGPNSLPPFALFGSGPTAAGTPLTAGFPLYITAVPEPATFALAGLGAAALLIFRRRK